MLEDDVLRRHLFRLKIDKIPDKYWEKIGTVELGYGYRIGIIQNKMTLPPNWEDYPNDIPVVFEQKYLPVVWAVIMHPQGKTEMELMKIDVGKICSIECKIG